MSNTKVSASIVVYGGVDEAIKAAHSLCANTKKTDLTLYLLDNASPNNSAEVLASEKFEENVNIICLDKNVGFGKGHNTVLPMINSKYHAVVNPDITIDTDTISYLCDYLDSHEDVVMVTPRLYFPDKTPQYTAKRAPTFMAMLSRQLRCFPKIEKHYLMLDEDLEKDQIIDFCTGSFFVIRTDVFKKIGGFDKDYFMYAEDADITRKAQKEGKVMYVAGTYVYHAWHRETRKKWKHFCMQFCSILLYWKKWGFKFI